MKLKKLLLGTLIAVLFACLTLGQTISYAADTTKDIMYVGIKDTRSSGKGYSIGQGEKTSGYIKKIWDLISYADSEGLKLSDGNEKIYCVKGGVGFRDTGSIATYNQSYNLKTQRAEIANLSTFSTNYSDIAGEYYYHILWILDNMYVPGVSSEDSRATLLRNAEIDISDGYLAFPLTDEEIEVTQQLALWHYTNYGEGSEESPNYYLSTNSETALVKLENWLSIMEKDGTEYNQLSKFHSNSDEEGPAKIEQIKLLYKYLIEGAEENADSYKNTASDELGAPAEVTTKAIGITQSGNNYLAGPINIVQNNSLPYTVNIKVTNQDGTDITSKAKYVDASGKEVTNLEKATEFYVQVPTSVATTIKINIDIEYETTDITLWVSTTALNDACEQPIVVINKTPNKISTTLETSDKNFDLALRKFITAISDDITFGAGDYVTSDGTSTGTYTREPSVSYTNGAIKYSHTKEALKVKNGDYIEYTLRIFNEGNIDGYAQEITDYILKNQGLQFVPEHETNIAYGWKMYDESGSETTDATKAVKVKTDYLSKEKNATDNLLKAFNKTADISTTNPDHRDLKLVFKVIEPNSSKNTLVNIAEISKDYNDEEDVDDIDSVPGTDKKDYPNNGYNTEEHEDDIDYEPVVLYKFDLALKKFIAAVSSDATIEEGEYITDTGKSDGTYTRAPKVKSIENGKITYEENSKQAYPVANGDYVLYTFRIYNEGELDGYASLIRDSIPDGLEFVTTDITYNGIWTLDKEDDSKSITTDYLAKGNGAELDSVEGETNYTANLLKALQTDESGNGTVSETSPLNPDYRDIQVLFKVTEPSSSTRILTNYAQIADDTDSKGNPIDDIDSITDEWNEGEDDQDIERVQLRNFDLALRKFITNVSGQEVTTRIPTVKYADNKITYEHTKDPMLVAVGDVVTYTIRVYNEGNIAGYASEIADDIPDYLTYLPDNETNKKYGWVMYDKDKKETTNIAEAVEIRTTYLSKDKETTAGEYLLDAFDSSAEISETNPDYLELQVAFQVKDPGSNTTIITNQAQITKDTDENGKEIDDRDSVTDKWNEGEDDQDIENVQVQYFDLALLKYVSKVMVTEDGKQKITKTGNTGADTDIIPKVEIHRKKVNSTVVKFAYTIKVTNEGDIAGYAKELTDYIPEGLKFVAKDNPNWKDNGDGSISTTALEDKLLKPGESATVEVIFTWINGSENLGLKTNTAEISKDYNEKGAPDRDSTPGNKAAGEDDIDTADVLLSISTGAARTYIVLAGAVLIVLASGIVIIRRFVL